MKGKVEGQVDGACKMVALRERNAGRTPEDATRFVSVLLSAQPPVSCIVYLSNKVEVERKHISLQQRKVQSEYSVQFQ